MSRQEVIDEAIEVLEVYANNGPFLSPWGAGRSIGADDAAKNLACDAWQSVCCGEHTSQFDALEAAARLREGRRVVAGRWT